MVLVAVAPALAQVGAGAGIEEAESGDAEGSTEVSNKGDLTSQCVTGGNFTQSGNAVGAGAVGQYQTGTDDIGIGGSTIEFGGGIAGECTQTIEVKGAEKKVEVKAPEVKVEVPKVEVKAEAPKVEVKAEAPKVEVKVEEKKEEKKALPKTGGEASLLALGAGVLLVAGGLLARRIIR